VSPASLVTDRPHLSVVIPAYNEEDRLTRSLPLIDSYLRENEIRVEILVVDDGSNDGTAELARSVLHGTVGRVLVAPENRGKGHAVRTGVLASRGRWVLITDADLSTPIEEHARLAAIVRDHDLDGAIGSRAMAESKIEVRQPFWREGMGITFNLFVRLLTGLPFRDTQCGFKLLDRQRTRPIFERMVIDRFAFDVELLFLCERFGLKLREVPITWRNDARSTVGPIVDSSRMLADVLRVRWRFRRGLYNPDLGVRS